MKKNFVLKRVLIGVLLLCGILTYTSFHTASAALRKMEDHCQSWTDSMAQYQDQEKCWTCKIFVLLFDAADKVAGQINNALSGPAGKVIILGVALFVVFNTLVFFSEVGDAPDLMAFLTKIGGMILKAACGYFLLEGGAALAFEYIVNPVLKEAAHLTTLIMSSTGISAGCDFVAGSGKMTGPMGEGVRDSLKCMIEKIASGMARSQSIAQGLRCGAAFWKEFDFGYLPNPVMWATGMVFGCFFWLISFILPIVMLDVIFRIGLVVGMLPLFITAWIFPITQQFAKQAWEIFAQACFVFVITGIIVCMIVQLVDQSWVAGRSDRLDEFQTKMESSSYVEAWDILFEGGIGQGLMSLFIVLAVCFWGLGIAAKADRFAYQFFGEKDDDILDNCAMRSIFMMISFIFDVIMVIITLISLGATSFMYMFKLAKFLMDGMEKVEKIIELLRKIREKIEKVQEKAEKLRAKADKISSTAEKFLLK